MSRVNKIDIFGISAKFYIRYLGFVRSSPSKIMIKASYLLGNRDYVGRDFVL